MASLTRFHCSSTSMTIDCQHSLRADIHYRPTLASQSGLLSVVDNRSAPHWPSAYFKTGVQLIESEMQKREVDEEELQALKDAFAMMDNDGSGSISTKEFGMMMRGLGQAVTEAEVQDMVHEIDFDDNGSITLDEFVAMMTARLKQRDPEEEIREAFDVFDREKTGYIDANDIRHVMCSMGERLTLDEAKAMIADADQDDDGKVSFDDFVKLMRSSD